MEKLLDFSGPFDVNLLDRVVDVLYSGSGTSEEIKQADSVLNQLRDNQDSWIRAGEILQDSKNPNSKFFALATLDKLIKTRWKTLPLDQRQGVRNFVGTMCMEWASTPEIFENQRTLLNKADLTLVEILKQDWPQHWPSFIPDITASSRSSVEVCENNMTILRLLSEEVFDYSRDQMTQAKARNLKNQLSSEFGEIFTLCHEVLKMASRPSLIAATLQCLGRYLSWVPLQFVFETDIIELLVTKFLSPFPYRNLTLKCLTEIAGLNAQQYNSQLVQMFAGAIAQVIPILSSGQDLPTIYRTASTADQDFIQNLSLFLSIFLSNHLSLIEEADPALNMQVHMLLLQISQVEEREIFKGCLEYWAKLVRILYDEIAALSNYNSAGNFQFNLSQGAIDPSELKRFQHLRVHKYSEILAKLRLVVIENMARPEEVLISENEDGEIVRVAIKENDTITLYNNMRNVLVCLTHLNVDNTQEIMIEKLDRQLDGSEWSWHKLNTLCWAIGSISGAMNILTEKQFLVYVIKQLLKLTERKSTKDSKAVVASNIMYIVGQYPRFLRTRVHWSFLKAVVKKLFQFMHESHEGVQDMACDTFQKIATKCRLQFIENNPDDNRPFIEEIIADVMDHTSDLEPHQVHSFYESCGHILSGQRVKNTQIRLLEDLMRYPNHAWTEIVQQLASLPPNEVPSTDLLKILINVIKTNSAVCGSLGSPYESQLSLMFSDMMGLYEAISKTILFNSQQNPQFPLTHACRLLRSVKREILRLLESYISKAENLEKVGDELAPALLTTILQDYQNAPPPLREYEVLRCVTAIVERAADRISNMVLAIFANVFECTLGMLTEDLTEYPEFRIAFFKLLRAINKHCFSTLLQLPPEIFSETLKACLWAAKHDNRAVEDEGLGLTLEIVVNVLKMNQPDITGPFFKQYTGLIVGDTFMVLTDPDHRSGFQLQSTIFLTFIQAIEENKIPVPLYEEDQAPAGTTNAQYFRDYLIKSLKNAFPNLLEQQIVVFVEGMFSLYNNPIAFNSHLRDFLVQIKEFGGDETDYLYAEERAREIEEEKRVQRQRDMQIGGMIRPAELSEDEDD